MGSKRIRNCFEVDLRAVIAYPLLRVPASCEREPLRRRRALELVVLTELEFIVYAKVIGLLKEDAHAAIAPAVGNVFGSGAHALGARVVWSLEAAVL